MLKDVDARTTELKDKFAGLPHRLVVISGPSAGAGKGKVIDQLLEMAGKDIWQSVSMTTRQLRADDNIHHHYTFVSREEFDQSEAAGELLEANGVTEGNRYGTPLQPILDHLRNGKVVLLEIEIQGARCVHEVVPDGIYLFIKPTDGTLDDDIAELQVRLEGRGTNDEASIGRRLKQAAGELKEAREVGIYDAFVVNARGESEKASREILEMIEKKWPDA